MPSSIDVANLFLSWANRDGDLITNLKLQKLLYYAQAWHLVYFKKPLFVDVIKAWDFGPVVLGAYHAFKKFNHSPIKYKTDNKEAKKFTIKQIEFLDSCYETFVKYPAYALVNMVHNESPWKAAYEKGRTTEITHKSMRDFYTKLLKKRK